MLFFDKGCFIILKRNYIQPLHNQMHKQEDAWVASLVGSCMLGGGTGGAQACSRNE
jgi:hypothetical protein